MSFSFLENLWDTESNSAFTSEQSNPAGRRYVGGAAGMHQPTPQVMQQQQQQQTQQPSPPEQTYSMTQYPPEPQQAPHMVSASRSGRAGAGAGPGPDANTEMKALLRATLGQLYENNNQEYHKIQQLKEGRGKLTKNIQNLTYVVYALLVLCFVMAILLMIVCYKVNNLGPQHQHQHQHLVSKHQHH